ncbi:uncharacterized protein BX664DRAFT_322730 [Halteromyces radiatus]|uniref:uncharacterized protein n=1 Tax=Halteromyces radiatus TaxID=101107 RepID=UPI0022204689|nr:uncharacterized protein BX664DRAFT_322730 [Halteromyces radiatus]KAI8100045.1 hypothetical protein BX664DRAFT_322730 [Halteromyces radiatus]
MFSQSKSNNSTFKFIIRSDISSTVDSETCTAFTSESINNNINTESVATNTTSSHTQPPSLATETTAIPLNEERKRKRSDKDNISLASKKVYSHLERWHQKHEELITTTNESTQNDIETTQQLNDLSTERKKEDFGDYRLLACLLCNRKFKTKQDVTRHQALSDLHKRNSQDPNTVARARNRLRQSNQTTESNTEKSLDSEEVSSSITYRNRAAERRQAYNQPENPILPSVYSKQRSNKSIQDTDPIKKSYETGSTLSKPIADNNVGAKMLKQMGWKSGQGLGKEGSGIINPINVQQSTMAGLGASQAGRINADGSGDSYKERAKELARRRLLEEL